MTQAPVSRLCPLPPGCGEECGLGVRARIRPRWMAIGSAGFGTVAFVLLAAAVGALPVRAERVVAIGDIHGAYSQLVGVLQRAGLADARLAWAGGSATLVQTGDFLDRGPDARKVMDLLRSLQRQSVARGGRVLVLLGNHEALNLIGDLRYVAPEAVAAFADEKSEKRRREALRDWERWLAERSAAAGEPPPAVDEAARERWLAEYPPGRLEYQEALSSAGAYGRWLRSLPAIARVGDTVFVHGGLSPEVAALGLEAVNAHVARELRTLDETRRLLVEERVILPFFNLADSLAAVDRELARRSKSADLDAPPERVGRALRDFRGLLGWLINRPEGPLWFRGYAHWSDEEGRALVPGLLQALGARHLVVGHTSPDPPGSIRERFDGAVYLIDTGMLPGHYPGGRPSALEIAGDSFTALYEDGKEPLPGDPRPAAGSAPPQPSRRWIGPDGKPLPFRVEAEVIEYLRTAKVVSSEAIPVGVTRPRKLLLEKDGIRAHAVFRTLDEVKSRTVLHGGRVILNPRDSYRSEVAAFELARLLGISNVAPAVERRLQSDDGSIQIWIEQAMTELDRRKRELQPPDGVSWRRQWWDMHVWDNLVGNIDRNQGNILIGPDWTVWWIDHTRAFQRDPALWRPEWVTHCSRSLFEALRSLDEESVTHVLRSYMGRFDLEGLLSRRRALVELIERKIAEHGERNVLFSYDAPPAAGEGEEPLEVPPPEPEPAAPGAPDGSPKSSRNRGGQRGAP